MNTARRAHSLPPDSDSNSNVSKSPAPSGQYRMVQPRPESVMPAPLPPRRKRASNNTEYLDPQDRGFAKPVNGASLRSVPPASTPMHAQAPASAPGKAPEDLWKNEPSKPVKSGKPKVVSLVSLDDAFEDETSDEDGPAGEAPDSLVQMMDGLEGAKVKEEAAWPKEMPAVPKPPSVPKMEAIRPIQPPISKMTPGPVDEHKVIGEFAKFGPPPESLWQCVGYMFHIRARREQLKKELGLYRERRPSDVDLYEKALRHIDEGAMRRGYLMLAGGAVLGVLVIVMICVLL